MTNYEYYKEQFKKIYGDNIEVERKCFTIVNDKIEDYSNEVECYGCYFEEMCSNAGSCVLGIAATKKWLESEYAHD